MPSTIINIQSGYSFAKSYHVDPTMPAVLRSSGGVHEVEWKSFCDQVNTRLDPLNKLQRMLQIYSALLFIAFIAVMAVMIISFTSINDSFDSTANNGISFSSGPIKSIVIPFLILFSLSAGMTGLICYISKQSQEAYKGVHDICVEASKRNRNVSYHFRNIVVVSGYSPGTMTHTHDRNIYIEVIFGDQMIVVQEPIYPTSVAVLTPATRLQQLEDMKHLLSAQEYDDKRSIILAAM
jgi:hypothetical protein